MLSIGFFEILVIAVLGLLVFGPEKLPEAIRTFAFGFSKAKRAWNNTKRDLEQELGMDEIRREIHNAQVMEDLEKLKAKTKNAAEDIVKGIEESEALSADAGDDPSPHSSTEDSKPSTSSHPTSSSSNNSEAAADREADTKNK